MKDPRDEGLRELARMRERLEVDTVEKLKADARALWAVRVLDAWRHSSPNHSTSESAGWRIFDNNPRLKCNGDCRLQLLYDGEQTSERWADDFDAARLAAALAVYPELPEPIRRELGECP